MNRLPKKKDRTADKCPTKCRQEAFVISRRGDGHIYNPIAPEFGNCFLAWHTFEEAEAVRVQRGIVNAEVMRLAIEEDA